MYFDPATNARLILAACERAGVPAKRILREAQVDPARIDPPTLHIPWPDLERLLEAAERLTGDPYIGLHAGAHADAKYFGSWVRYAVNQPTTRDYWKIGGLQVLRRWTNLVVPELLDAGDACISRLSSPLEDAPMMRHVIDYHFAFALIGIQHPVDPHWHPIEVRRKRIPAESVRHYEHAFGCSVIAGAEHDDFVLDRAIMERPMVMYDPAMNEWLRPLFDAHMAAMEQDLSATLWLRERMVQQMTGAVSPTVAILAKELDLGRRALQVRLKAEGTSFRAVLDRVRREQATLALAAPAAKLDDVAAQLGFSDAATLVRAFHRWTGMTPAEWRKARDHGMAGGTPPTLRSPG